MPAPYFIKDTPVAMAGLPEMEGLVRVGEGEMPGLVADYMVMVHWDNGEESWEDVEDLIPLDLLDFGA